MLFSFVLAFVSILAGGIAVISDVGIGSLITPLLSTRTGITTAIVGVAIAHFLGTILHCYLWRKYINKKVLLAFGIPSAAGGLLGAYLNANLNSVVLATIFAWLLIFFGAMGLSGLVKYFRLPSGVSWFVGIVSGVLGGLVGNQGGIRAASMLSFKLTGKQFIATAIAISLMVDIARIPVYVMLEREKIFSIWHFILVATVGVALGTFIGSRVLEKIPDKIYRLGISAIIFFIGIYELLHRFSL